MKAASFPRSKLRINKNKCVGLVVGREMTEKIHKTQLGEIHYWINILSL